MGARNVKGESFTQIPDHQLIRKIGGGSYGEVWLARNALGTYRAVKIVYRRNFAHERPFEREFGGIQKYEPISRSQDGLMDILQVGRDDQAGHFYYVMELADGINSGPAIDPDSYVPHTLAYEISERGHLPFEECLNIGLALSSALAALHKHSLVHRDVKPSNIVFVNRVAELADIGLVTDIEEARSYVGTEGFIPPEGPGTPQADIYSLGKVLYEISTGMDRQDYPALPSKLWEAETEHELQELNEIVLKACRADPAQRYKTADQMHADLLLLQRGRSIKQVRKLQKRLAFASRVGLGAVAVALLASGAWLGSIRQIHRARAAEKTARGEAAKSEALKTFLMEDLVMEASPERNPDRNITLRAALNKAAAKVDSRFTNQLELAAAVHHDVGEVYLTLDEQAQAEAHYQKALDLRQHLLGKTHPDTLETLDRIATLREWQGRVAEAEALYRNNLETRLRVFGPENKATLGSVNNLVVFLINQARPAEAETLVRQYLPAMERVWGEEGSMTLENEAHLALCLQRLGRVEEALSIMERVHEPIQRARGREHPNALSASSHYATILQANRRFSEAEKIFRRELAIRQQVQGSNHWNTLVALHNLGFCLEDATKLEEALKCYTGAGGTLRDQFGMDDVRTLQVLGHKAVLLHRLSRDAEAEPLLTELLQHRHRMPAGVKCDTLIALGEALTEGSKAAEAEMLLLEALEVSGKALPFLPRRPAEAKSALGACLTSLGRYPEAEALLLEANQAFEETGNISPALLTKGHRRVITLYQSWGKTEDARYWESRFVDSWELGF